MSSIKHREVIHFSWDTMASKQTSFFFKEEKPTKSHKWGLKGHPLRFLNQLREHGTLTRASAIGAGFIMERVFLTHRGGSRAWQDGGGWSCSGQNHQTRWWGRGEKQEPLFLYRNTKPAPPAAAFLSSSDIKQWPKRQFPSPLLGSDVGVPDEISCNHLSFLGGVTTPAALIKCP